MDRQNPWVDWWIDHTHIHTQGESKKDRKKRTEQNRTKPKPKPKRSLFSALLCSVLFCSVFEEGQDEPALAMAPRLLSFSLVSFLILRLLPSLCLSLSLDRSMHPRLLVLIDDFALKSSHSIFFNSLLGNLLLPLPGFFFLKLFSLYFLWFLFFSDLQIVVMSLILSSHRTHPSLWRNMESISSMGLSCFLPLKKVSDFCGIISVILLHTCKEECRFFSIKMFIIHFIWKDK